MLDQHEEINFNRILTDLMLKQGYLADIGVCFGYTILLAQALVTGLKKDFFARVDLMIELDKKGILNDLVTIVVNGFEKKANTQENLYEYALQHKEELIDIKGYLDVVEVMHNARHFVYDESQEHDIASSHKRKAQLFTERLTHEDAPSIGTLTSSIESEKRLNFDRIRGLSYTNQIFDEDLQDLMTLIKDYETKMTALKFNKEATDDIVVTIGTGAHIILLRFNSETSVWTLNNIRQYPEQTFKSPDQLHELAKAIEAQTFMTETPLTSFNTYVAGNYAHQAAKLNRVDILKQLHEDQFDWYRKDLNGDTVLHIALLNKSDDALAYLASHYRSDLLEENNDHITPLDLILNSDKSIQNLFKDKLIEIFEKALINNDTAILAKFNNQSVVVHDDALMRNLIKDHNYPAVMQILLLRDSKATSPYTLALLDDHKDKLTNLFLSYLDRLPANDKQKQILLEKTIAGENGLGELLNKSSVVASFLNFRTSISSLIAKGKMTTPHTQKVIDYFQGPQNKVKPPIL